ncbi:site-2 protease family protein [Clostridium gasigenes]|uniref:Site-2 protease family protein n=1 Tax=Clostridium gasigenes TaxID=94869 RepID=A0A1H0TZ62_9CLOT|nr:site-2 protease family protein [Clostridium gasigenes]MBB6714729.1 site-2 protease family protein [Clostridium gasigenes]MBU3105197.1 site-2 protease family protein [Clostridium gasigenes]MBU3132023.1 site-2 protease family protein [Clostridium gasigenes]NKF07055.1 site-2 protease family protein [Clostridium gasigenes]QSW19690.1 site-2 protease family protein [Clostridium gasigenes]
MADKLLDIIFTIPAILIAFTVQGYAKAKMADKLGDKTPRFQGRLSLNPIDHIDPMGFLMIIICGFGWTKPLDTNPNAYKRGQKDAIKVTVAGPLANLLVGFVGSFIFIFFIYILGNMMPESMYMVASNMLRSIVLINISLFVFNLLPLPGLAGFEIMKNLWPKTYYKVADTIYQYQMFILIGVLLIGGKILGIPVGIIYTLFITIAKAVVGIFI